MADIPMDENLASIMISGQYILGYLFSSIAMIRSRIKNSCWYLNF